MDRKTDINSSKIDKDISMNDFLINHHDVTTICVPEEMSSKIKKGKTVKLANPYKNKKDIFKCLSNPIRHNHGIIEFKAKLL